MATDIEEATPAEAIGIVRNTLEKAGWKTLPDTPAVKAHLVYDEVVEMKVQYAPEETVPKRFLWRFMIDSSPVDIFIDFGEQLPTLLSIIAEYAPQVQPDNYRGIIAALVKLLPAVYKLDAGKLRRLELSGWE